MVLNKVKVKWNFELELRSWGIHGISVTCPDQKVHISGKFIEENGDTLPFSKDIEIKKVTVEYDKIKDDFFPTKLKWFKKFELEF